MDVRRHPGGVIERADTNEPNELTDATKQDQVIAPDSNLAVRAAGNSLVCPTGGWHLDIDDITLE